MLEQILSLGGYVAALLLFGGGAYSQLKHWHGEKPDGLIMASGFFIVMLGLGLIQPRAQGERLLVVLGFVGAYALTLGRAAQVRRWLGWLAWPMALATIGQGLITQQRPDYINPNQIAALLLLSGVQAQIAAWPALFITQSRASLFGAMAAMAVYARQQMPSLRVISLPLVALAALGLCGVLTIGRINTATVRMQTWNKAWVLFTTRPWLGWGTGAYLSWGKDHADSFPLTVAVENGLMGLLAGLPVAAIIAHRAACSSAPERYAILAFAISNVLDCTVAIPLVAILFGANVALLGDSNVYHRYDVTDCPVL